MNDSWLCFGAAGKLENKISWRGDSGLEDGSEAGLDLSKGLYDAGDHMKFGLPMAFTATLLSWSILEYGHHMDSVNQLEPAKDSLKWITDFLIHAHPSANVLYIQVQRSYASRAGSGRSLMKHLFWFPKSFKVLYIIKNLKL